MIPLKILLLCTRPVPEKMRLEMVTWIQNGILIGQSSCFYLNEIFGKNDHPVIITWSFRIPNFRYNNLFDFLPGPGCTNVKRQLSALWFRIHWGSKISTGSPSQIVSAANLKSYTSLAATVASQNVWRGAFVIKEIIRRTATLSMTMEMVLIKK